MQKLLGTLVVSCTIAFGAGAFMLSTQNADKQAGQKGAGAANAALPPRDSDPLPTVGGSGGPPRLKVEVADAERGDWQDWQSTLSTVKAANSISVKAAVSGRITRVQKSGAHVELGDILIQLDDGKERAQLDAKLAALSQARRAYERVSVLARQSASSVASLQSAETDLRLAEADVAFQHAFLTDFTIRAPFAGEIGFHDLVEGQRIDSGQTLFTLQDTGLLLVEFRVPVDYAGKSVNGMSIIVESREPELSLLVPVSVASAYVDSETSTIQMRAELPGGTGLRPGMSPRVRYATRRINDVIVLPSLALVDSAYGASVFVVNSEGVVEQRFVTVVGSNGGRVGVSGDLQQGETVVVTGQMRLYPGAVVTTQSFQNTAEKLASSAKSDGPSKDLE